MEAHMVLLLSSLETDTVIWFQILLKAVCISHCTNTLGKSMNPTILLPAMANSRADWAL